MGLFDWLRGSEEEDLQFDYNSLDGERVEVMNPQEDKLLFAARMEIKPDRMQLRPTPAFEAKGVERLAVVLRCYDKEGKQAVHLRANLIKAASKWVISRPQVISLENDRSGVRENINVDGKLRPVSINGRSTVTCRITNISVGGVGVHCDRELKVGEKFILTSSLFTKWGIPAQNCVVRRVTVKPRDFECGLEFEDLSTNDEHLIAREIMDLERRRMQFGFGSEE